MKEKLDIVLDLNQMKQTRSKRSILRFGDSIINKITKTTTDFGSKRLKKISFDINKGSSLKGLMSGFYKSTQKKLFVIEFWFNDRNEY
jgi:hypothetical protein